MSLHSKGLSIALVVLLACGESEPTSLTGLQLQAATAGSIKFLTQANPTVVGMEALFTGGLVVDDNGCIRLDSPDDATVIWPHGYRLDLVAGVGLVRDDHGRAVGLLDGDFALAGGEVPELPPAMGFTQSDASYLAVHCPGRYWIVNGG